jgi:peptidoglycan hydrolase FlgJ
MNDIVINNAAPAVTNASCKNGESQQRKIEEEKLKKVCADFESLFVYNMLQTMRKTIPAGDSAAQSFGKETYSMMFDQKVAEELSGKGGGMGLQTVLFNQLKNTPYRK